MPETIVHGNCPGQRIGAVVILFTLMAGSGSLFADERPLRRDVPERAGAGGVWGLSPGDEFRASVVISKRTSISAGGQAPGVFESTDRFQVQYQLLGTDRSGLTLISARIVEPSRELPSGSSREFQATSERLAPLNELPMFFTIDRDGQIEQLMPAAREELLTELARNDPRMRELLKRSLPDEAMTGWISQPFWMVLPDGDVKPGLSWPRTSILSVGPFGLIRCELTMSVADVDGDKASVKITDESRFVPLVVPDSAPHRLSPLLAGIRLEETGISGEATVSHFSEPGAGQPVSPRPQFEALSLTTTIRGTAVAAVPDESGASENTAGKSAEITFEHVQVQSWILNQFSSGRPEFRFERGLPVVPVR